MNELKQAQQMILKAPQAQDKLLMRDGRVYDIANFVNSVMVYEERDSGAINSPNFGESLITRNETDNLSYEDFRQENEPAYFIT